MMTKSSAPVHTEQAYPHPDSSVLFDNLAHYDRAAEFLRRAARQHMLSHAYLFLGSAASGKQEAAWAFAQAILCPAGGCGSCPACHMVAHHTHPDIHVMAPDSAQGYRVDMIRDLIDEVQYAPVEAPYSIFLLTEAERLNPASANAFLKVLEEPPHNVIFILLASARQAVLPTILSRCQVIPFATISPSAACELLMQKSGCSSGECRRALACCPSLTDATLFLSSPTHQKARQVALQMLQELPRADAARISDTVRLLLDVIKQESEELRTQQEEILAESSGILSESALREIEERQIRELKLALQQGIIEVLRAQRSLLRDALIYASHTDEPGANDDFSPAASQLAHLLGCQHIPAAVAAIDKAEQQLSRNVTPQLALEAMLLTLKEIVTCQP